MGLSIPSCPIGAVCPLGTWECYDLGECLTNVSFKGDCHQRPRSILNPGTAFPPKVHDTGERVTPPLCSQCCVQPGGKELLEWCHLIQWKFRQVSCLQHPAQVKWVVPGTRSGSWADQDSPIPTPAAITGDFLTFPGVYNGHSFVLVTACDARWSASQPPTTCLPTSTSVLWDSGLYQ